MHWILCLFGCHDFLIWHGHENKPYIQCAHCGKKEYV